MLAFTVRRIVLSIPILIVAAFVTFALSASAASPLAPLLAKNPPAPPNVIVAETARLHLNQPLIPRFFDWLVGLLHGDWGPSVTSTLNIGSELGGRFLVTLRLIALAMVVALVLAIVIGVITAVKQYSVTDYTATFVGFLFIAMPSFWFAILLKQLGINFNLAVGDNVISTIGAASVPGKVGFWPVLGDVLGHMILPTISLALISYASWSRFQRTSMLEVLNSDYIRLARSKGLPRNTVMVRHALRTALIPLTTVTALDVAAIIGGAVVTERVFQWKGMGDFLLTAITANDAYALAGWLLVSAVVVILFNLVADLLYAVLDPRIRYA